ncbi:MAG TPA: choice-of-anchor I family protein, partial [Chitinophagaceae bacterium]|nr:choice-of-anchor I family protein [Chitinophagaceae bacterium]
MKYVRFSTIFLFILVSCQKPDVTEERSVRSQARGNKQESVNFQEVGFIDLGSEGASEISAYDPLTSKLFVVNNAGVNKIDVVDLSNPSAPVYITSILMAPFGGLVNSVAVHDGKLAAAIEASPKTNNGQVVVFSTSDYTVIATATVGAQPDMITWSPDGEYILTANEGEPNDAYTIDPVGSVSIIHAKEDYTVNTIDFSSFSSQQEELVQQGLRIFGPNASFAQDIEPEYIAVSSNSRTAWVTLQENNGIARIDLRSQVITDIFPLGFKNYNLPANAMDVSDNDGSIQFNTWPVYGIYQPDAIAVIPSNGTPFIFTANEGDARDYKGFSEVRRVNHSSIMLDPAAFPGTTSWKTNAILGRLNITTTM